MSNLKLALKSVVRNFGRSFILAMILIIVASTLAISLSIKAGTEHRLEQFGRTVGHSVILRVKPEYYKAVQEGKQKKKTVNEDIANKIINSKHLAAYDYEMFIATIPNINFFNKAEDRMVNIDGYELLHQDSVVIYCNLNPEKQSHFRFNEKYMIEGRFYTEEDDKQGNPVVVISENLAKLNNLNLGDVIAVKEYSEGVTIDLTIIGIYGDKVKQEYSKDEKTYLIRDNDMYMPYYTAKELVGRYHTNKKSLHIATYFFDKYSDVARFKKDVENSDLDNNVFEVSATRNILIATSPLINVKAKADNVLATVSIFGAFIIALTIALITKKQKNEINSLRKMGFSKNNIVKQKTFEFIIIALIAVAIAIPFANTLSQKTADFYMHKEILKSDTEIKTVENGIIIDPYDLKVIDEFKVKLDLQEVLTLVVLTLVISSLGIITSAYLIKKHNDMGIINS